MVSQPRELTHLIGEEYRKVRLRKRPSHPSNTKGKIIRNILLKLKLNISKNRLTKPFLMKDLEVVLKTLKSNKSRDPEGFDRTIFGAKMGGKNLKVSILKLFNEMKNKSEVPIFMRKALVSTIPKKDSKLLLKN